MTTATINDLILSADELFTLTRYRRAAEQLRALRDLGIPARRMHDNTVRVLRMHLMLPAGASAGAGAMKPTPQRKSARR